MIRTNKLTKQFDSRVAVDAIDLDIHDGEVFGLLGPNGAGKTTTVRMLSCLIAPTAGEAFVGGFKVGRDDNQIRRTIGILTESPGLYERLSAWSNLEFYARLYEVPPDNCKRQVEKYLSMLGLWARRNEAVGSFSKGMKQKMAIARALVHEPRVLFLDEPTSGLDPEAAKMVRDFVEELKEEGRTIVLCTHNLDEADRLCDRIGILKQHLIQVDTPDNLRQMLYGRRTVIQLKSASPKVLDSIGRLGFASSVRQEGQSVIVPVARPEEQNPVLIRTIVDAGGEIIFVTEQRASLEEVYLNLIKEGSES
ncbi:MAG: ABC transporter ATP-binding protein [Dehalococcoidales bacterium]|nr:ABC transporter ATP-binding protein [Dehalococcoidales bacterium]